MKKLLGKKGISKQNIIRIVAIIGVCIVAAYSAITLASNYIDISKLNAQATQAQDTYDKQVEENENIKSILNSDDKDEYIEQKAREKGYVKSGETVFYDISSSK